MDRKYVIRAGSFLLLVFIIWMTASGTYRKLPWFYEDVIRIGVFSDSYWEVQNGYSCQILDDAIALFEERHPGVTVEYTSGIMKEDYPEWLSEQILKGTAPDLFYMPGEYFNDFAEIGALKELTPLIEGDETFDPDQYFTSAYGDGAYEGIQYALPFECAPKLMFVNKSILNAEGIVMPDGSWTWETFYEICRQVTRDTDGNETVDQFGTVGYTWEDAFDSNGVVLFDERGTECYLTDRKAGAAISFLEKLEALNSGYSVSSREFALGNVAFQPMLFSEYRAYRSYPLSIKKYSGFEWDCLPMPAGPDGGNVSRLDTLSIAMSASTIHTEQAWELMKLLTCEEEIQTEIFDYSEGVPVQRAVVEAKWSQINAAEGGSAMDLQILSRAVEEAVATPRFHDHKEAVEEVDRAIRIILEGNSNINMETIIQNRNINNYLRAKQ